MDMLGLGNVVEELPQDGALELRVVGDELLILDGVHQRPPPLLERAVVLSRVTPRPVSGLALVAQTNADPDRTGRVRDGVPYNAFCFEVNAVHASGFTPSAESCARQIF